MSEASILRRLRATDLHVGTVASDSTTLRFDDMAGASVIVSGINTAVTQLRVYGAVDDSQYRQVYDAAGQAATITVARLSGTAVETVGTATVEVTVYTAQSATYPMPDAAYPLRYVRLVADAVMGQSATVVAVAKG